MTQTQLGWLIFLAAIGMMCTLIAADVSSLKQWADLGRPLFIGSFIGHLGAVIAAFVGGKLIPTKDR